MLSTIRLTAFLSLGFCFTASSLAQNNWSASVLSTGSTFGSGLALSGISGKWSGYVGPAPDLNGYNNLNAFFATNNKAYVLAANSSMALDFNSLFIVGFTGDMDNGPVIPVRWPMPTGNAIPSPISLPLPPGANSGVPISIRDDNTIFGCVSTSLLAGLNGVSTAGAWSGPTFAWNQLDVGSFSGTRANWAWGTAPIIGGGAIDPVTGLPTAIYWNSLSDAPHQLQANADITGTDGMYFYGSIDPWNNRVPTAWRISDGTTVNLMPPGMSFGEVDSVDGRYAVGEVSDGFVRHAALWTSPNASSYVDLAPFVSNASHTWATHVKIDGTKLVVMGWMNDNTTAQNLKPVRWTRNLSSIPTAPISLPKRLKNRLLKNGG